MGITNSSAADRIQAPARLGQLNRVFAGVHAKQLVIFAALSLAGYLITSALTLRIGFPLDDAWIHQTYARNLGLRGEWAFIPGVQSAGSTSPLWTILLAGGHLLSLGPYVLTFLLGWLSLAGTAVLGSAILRRWLPGQAVLAAAAGISLVFDWRLAWAAGSGMETLIYSLLILGVIFLLSEEKPAYLLTGLLTGLSVWVRPDGVTLLGPALMILFVAKRPGQEKLIDFCKLALGFAIPFVGYLVFNQVVGGEWWPNTFYAKQAEYAIYRERPFLQRFLSQALQPLVGIGIILLPGFIRMLRQAMRKRSWILLATSAWLVGYLGLYAFRLPVTYQHARYIIPAIPVYYLLGFYGMAGWLDVRSRVLLRRVFGRVWQVSAVLVLAIFWIQGAAVYARDVAVIESEMVASAKWVNENTDSQDLVAAHDIGALGYFGDRRLLDLAGLVSPEVIPFIRDEDKLGEFISAKKADYLVTFPEWYPQLSRDGELVFETGGEFSPAAGGTNMAIYRWR